VTRPGETTRRPLPRAVQTSLPIFVPVVHLQRLLRASRTYSKRPISLLTGATMKATSLRPSNESFLDSARDEKIEAIGTILALPRTGMTVTVVRLDLGW